MKRCNDIAAACACIRPKNHEGRHGCDCGGSWVYDAKGERVPVSLPILEGAVNPEYYE